ncbi:MAG: 4Fe-4S dicluster domain-containing protein [Desulfobacteraceae bacterium]|nr:4Fe-4S dicluster domain-containing protein [Desulfobacteraceae bacterium]
MKKNYILVLKNSIIFGRPFPLRLSKSISSCFTCRECSNACPICLDPSVFDPLKTFRLASFGLKDDLLRSPSIWLCLDCQSCMSACSQGVKGALIIRQIQHIAYEEGFVAKDFPVRWQ